MSTATTPDPAHTARLAAMLAENARLHARYDPEFADTMAHFARAFAGHAAIASLVAPASTPRRTRAVTGAQKADAAQRAADWINTYKDALPPGSGIPSARAIWTAYQNDEAAPVIPRTVLMNARFPEWKINDRGAPIK
jgi:hypothetical protein